MVLVDLTVSSDGGHLSIVHQQFWVHAGSKQRAAIQCVRHTKSIDGVLASRVIRVVAIEQWGEDYFTVLNAQ